METPHKPESNAPSVVESVLDKITALAVAAFGLVAALAWNDAIKGIFSLIFPSPEDNVLAQVLYAVFITVVVVVITILLSRYSKKAKEKLLRNGKNSE